MQEWVKTIDEDDDLAEQTKELNYQVEIIESKWNQFLSLEAEIEKELLDVKKKKFLLMLTIKSMNPFRVQLKMKSELLRMECTRNSQHHELPVTNLVL